MIHIWPLTERIVEKSLCHCSITVLVTSRLTGFYFHQTCKTFCSYNISQTVYFKQNKQVSRIVILPLNYGECSLTWITPHNRYLGMTPRVNPFLLFQLFVSFIHFPSCTFQNISHTKPFGLNLFKVI